MRKSDDSTIFQSIIFLVALCGFLYWFIRKAVRAGRLLELIVSSASLVGCYGMIAYALDNRYEVPIWTFFVPIGIYFIYWCVLFSFEKVTSVKADSKWANRDWWWTLDGWDFEEEVAKVFRLNGYKATVTRKTGDGGIDIILNKRGHTTVVQCKHYAYPVAPEVARALWGVREDYGTDDVILVASSGITSACSDFIRNKPSFKVMTLEDVIRMGLRPSNG